MLSERPEVRKARREAQRDALTSLLSHPGWKLVIDALEKRRQVVKKKLHARENVESMALASLEAVIIDETIDVPNHLLKTLEIELDPSKSLWGTLPPRE